MAEQHLLVALTLALTITLTSEAKVTIVLDDVTALVGHKFEYNIGDTEFNSVYRVIKVIKSAFFIFTLQLSPNITHHNDFAKFVSQNVLSSFQYLCQLAQTFI